MKVIFSLMLNVMLRLVFVKFSESDALGKTLTELGGIWCATQTTPGTLSKLPRERIRILLFP